jgi:predicted transcriptional regulator
MNQSLEPKSELKTEVKLYDSELKIMEYLWQCANAAQRVTAKDIAAEMARTVGWSKTTTYTVLKKCVEKGAVARHEPGFVCTPLVSMEQVQEYETRELINKMYQGSADLLVASLIGQQKLSGDEITRLKALVSQLEG